MKADVPRVCRREPSLTATAVPLATAWATVAPLSSLEVCETAHLQVAGREARAKVRDVGVDG